MEHSASAYAFANGRMKEIANGWPETVKHALHEAHQLVLSPRNSYLCDGCSEHGVEWSFYCSICDFDLHPKCALFGAKLEKNSADIAKGWPEKVKHALHEVHELVFSRRKIYICDGCSEPGVGWSFYCNKCDFDLHPQCAIDGAKDDKNSEDIPAKEIAKGWPEKAKHALHKQHELVLSCRKNYICDGCTEHGAGWSFYCNKCDFDLHPQCALDGQKVEKNFEDIPGKEITKGWPEKVKHALHEHELVLSRRNNYFCDGCKYPGVGWSFCCNQCNFDLHPNCALDGAKDDKNSEDIPADDIAKGWPEKAKHALHEEHELVFTRRKNYICDGCSEPGVGWSFCCNECNFDLHPKCAIDGAKDGKNSVDIPAKEIAKGWPEKAKHALHKPHELVRSCRKNYICDGCTEHGAGWSFYCNKCDFDLHPQCALDGEKVEKNSEDIPGKEITKGWPEKVKHALHEHELVLGRRNNYFCDGCKYPGVGWSFCCDQCNFDLHPKCALDGAKDDKNYEDILAHEISKEWPAKVNHALHKEHQLVLSHRKNYVCDGCNYPGNDRSFCCNQCNFDLHPKCALDGVKDEKNSKDIPAEDIAKGWPEKVKHALHEQHELVLSHRKNYVCDGCKYPGNGWSYCCNECNFDLHLKCALYGVKDVKNSEDIPAEDIVKRWPEKAKHALHEQHELVLSRRKNYFCDGCKYPGVAWSFCCNECNFDLHPKCALGVRDDKNSEDIPAHEMSKGWPKKVKHALHEEHELVFSRQKNYICDGCSEPGVGWSFCCNECNFDLHPKCALDGVKYDKNSEDIPAHEMSKGWPEKLKHALHAEHELVFSRRKNYICDGCSEPGVGWSFCCNKCNFDLHPKCSINMEAGDNDFKIAFELQLQDAIIVQEQKELMRKFDQEQKDAEEWGRDMGRVRNQIQVHTYDYRFAQELSRIPEDEWVKNGDNVHKPFDEVATSSSSVDDSEPFRLYFKGCYSNKSDGEGIVCAIGAAVCDSRDNLILNVQKPLIGDFNQEELEFKVEAEALMEGLKAALSLGIKKISFFCDFHPLFQYITTRWLIKEQNIEELVYQVCLLQKKFDSCFPFFVALKNVKFAFKLARDAIDTQITRSAESTHAKILKETCSICLEDTDISQMFVVDHCLHRYCLSCMKQHVQVKLLDEMMLRCPYEDCKTELDIGICRKFLPTELIDLMEQRLKESSIAVTYRVYCPDPRCSKLMSKPDMISNTDPADLPAVTCIKCQGLFCINCEVPWHSDIRCDEYKRLNPNPSSEDAKLKFLATTRSWTQCTKCKNMIELAEGCYHITCRCRYEFCYTCGFEWCDKKPTCTCPIWDERNILNDPEPV